MFSLWFILQLQPCLNRELMLIQFRYRALIHVFQIDRVENVPDSATGCVDSIREFWFSEFTGASENNSVCCTFMTNWWFACCSLLRPQRPQRRTLERRPLKRKKWSNLRLPWLRSPPQLHRNFEKFDSPRPSAGTTNQNQLLNKIRLSYQARRS